MQMRLINIAIFCLSCLAFTMAQAKDAKLDAQGKPCEEMVDLSETGQFHRLHFDCAEKKAPRDVEQDVPDNIAQPVAQTLEHDTLDHFKASAKFELSKASSLNTANQKVFQQMAKSCSKGWEKLRETVVLDGPSEHYQLIVQYQCLSQ